MTKKLLVFFVFAFVFSFIPFSNTYDLEMNSVLQIQANNNLSSTFLHTGQTLKVGC